MLEVVQLYLPEGLSSKDPSFWSMLWNLVRNSQEPDLLKLCSKDGQSGICGLPWALYSKVGHGAEAGSLNLLLLCSL